MRVADSISLTHVTGTRQGDAHACLTERLQRERRVADALGVRSRHHRGSQGPPRRSGRPPAAPRRTVEPRGRALVRTRRRAGLLGICSAPHPRTQGHFQPRLRNRLGLPRPKPPSRSVRNLHRKPGRRDPSHPRRLPPRRPLGRRLPRSQRRDARRDRRRRGHLPHGAHRSHEEYEPDYRGGRHAHSRRDRRRRLALRSAQRLRRHRRGAAGSHRRGEADGRCAAGDRRACLQVAQLKAAGLDEAEIKHAVADVLAAQ